MGDICCYPKGFDLARAIELAQLVQAAYDEFKDGANWKFPAGYTELGRFSAKGPGIAGQVKLFGFVAQKGSTAYVAFRGTQTLADWMANVDFKQVPFPYNNDDKHWGNTEKGFTGVYTQCSKSVRDALARGKDTKDLYVTGHSLGGSLATLCAADLSADYKPVLYTLASPRTGDLKFADTFNKQITAWRVVNSEDIVNTVPLATPVVEELNLGPGLDAIGKLQVAHPDHVAALHNVLGSIERFGEETLGAVEKISKPVGTVLALFTKLDYEHIGVSVDFTTHNGSVVNNHEVPTYLAALKAAP